MSAAVQEETVAVSESGVRGRPERVVRGWEQAKEGGQRPRDLDLSVAAEREKNKEAEI